MSAGGLPGLGVPRFVNCLMRWQSALVWFLGARGGVLMLLSPCDNAPLRCHLLQQGNGECRHQMLTWHAAKMLAACWQAWQRGVRRLQMCGPCMIVTDLPRVAQAGSTTRCG